MLGEAPRFVSVPPAIDFCCACQVCAPVVEVAVAPEPPPLVSPYVTVNVFPPASVSDETVIVCPETETVPLLEVHLFDCDQELYGRHLKVCFLEKLRDEKKYDGLDALKQAIAQDAGRAREYFAKHG